jgi:hypothetical protein
MHMSDFPFVVNKGVTGKVSILHCSTNPDAGKRGRSRKQHRLSKPIGHCKLLYGARQSILVTMPKKFQLSDNRFVVLKKDEIKIFENGTSKYAVFTYPRWNQFVDHISIIDENLTQMMQQQDVKLQQHLGGGWYVSVTSGYRCVDFRRFYLLPGVGVRPTKTGIALRLYEWSRLKEVVDEIKKNHPNVTTAEFCWMQPDHYNQEGAMACSECNPFGDWMLV